jgi:RNA polymerase sigma-70 factor (ECF subfamily)
MDSLHFAAFRRGDREATEKVYRDHIEVVERYVRTALFRAGKLSAANFADVVQDVFTKAFSRNARERYDGSREYAPFLMTIARNALVDWLRKFGRELPEGDLEPRFAPALSSAWVAEGETYGPELLAAVSSYVESLPAPLRAVHERRFIAAEPQERAAEALGISRQNLRTLERKLVDGLRRAIRRSRLVDEAERFQARALASSRGTERP